MAQVYVLYQEGPFEFRVRSVRAMSESEVPEAEAVPSLVLSEPWCFLEMFDGFKMF